jgi:hypothetical protein
MQDFYDAIKTLASGRVYPLAAPLKPTYPMVIYTPVASEKIWGLGGSHDLERIRVQVDAYAKTYNEALALQDAVQAALVAAKSTVADVRLVLSDFEEETRIYRVAVDYTYHR